MPFATKQTPLSKKTGYFYEGKEIALHKRQGATGKLARHNPKWFAEAQKIDAATAWAVVRDYKKVQILTGIPLAVLKNWSQEPWWDNIIHKVVKEKNDELDGRLTEAIHKVVDLIVDRIDNGELYPAGKDEEGNVVYERIPLKVRDAILAFEAVFNKRQLLRGEATSRSETISEERKLQTLKENFERLAKSKGINANGEIIEGETSHALEKWEISEGDIPEHQNGDESWQAPEASHSNSNEQSR